MRAIEHNIYILLLLFVGWSCTSEGLSGSGSGDDNDDVTEWMDAKLSYYYLYNDEYNEMSRDLTIDYDDFLDATLTQMTTNVLDNKDGVIYSFITCTESSKSVSTTRISEAKYLEWTYGVASAFVVMYGSDSYGVAIAAVTPSSPLDDKGVGRGKIITKINGSSITSSNINTYAEKLCYPSSGESMTLTFDDNSSVSLTAEYMYCSPILKSETFEWGGKKVGYLSYLSFDMAYDSELMEQMRSFKNEGVEEFILDLRLNGGGYVSTANKLATAIVGEQARGDVFCVYEYNPSRMALKDEASCTEYFSTSIGSEYFLNMSRLYCLVSEFTASASELIINSLDGIDFEVVLIGTQTEGKNVGMEILDTTIGGWDYIFYPITISLTNAKGFNDFANGFTPPNWVDDWDGGFNFADFTQNEVMINKALNLISPSGALSWDPSSAVVSRSSTSGASKGERLRANSRVSGALLHAE